MKKGLYFMFEGGEGVGKDYQADLLVPWLESKGYEIILTKEPGGTFEAEQIRDVLLNKKNSLDSLSELFLFEAARRDLNLKVIKPAIDSGKIVISKRGFPSTYAYQGFAGGMDLDLIDKMNQLAMQGVMPDMLFIIDSSPEKGLEKEVNPDRFAAKGLEYHKKVRQGYLDIAKRYPDITIIIPYKEGKPQTMQEEIRAHIINKFGI